MADVQLITQVRRAQLTRLQSVKHYHRQRAANLMNVRWNGGDQAVNERLAENVITEGHNFDLFVTPHELAKRMVSLAGIKRGMTALEPEAGTGRIAKAIREAGVEPVCVEFAQTASEFLKKQGYNVTQGNFMEYEPGIKFDAICMNPPFSNMQDIAHVLHAYSMLANGRTLVAIMSEGTFYSSRKKAQGFCDWLDAHGWSEQLPDGTFQESGTGVNARIVVIQKRSK